jgi:hypothetical protein
MVCLWAPLIGETWSARADDALCVQTRASVNVVKLNTSVMPAAMSVIYPRCLGTTLPVLEVTPSNVSRGTAHRIGVTVQLIARSTVALSESLFRAAGGFCTGNRRGSRGGGGPCMIEISPETSGGGQIAPFGVEAPGQVV